MIAQVAAGGADVRILLAVAVVTMSAQALGRGATLVGQPRVNGEIAAGILLGPSLLGVVWPSAFDALFPGSVVDALGVLAQVGVVVFMFLVGLELDVGELRRSGRRAAVISQASIALPLVLGGGLGLWLHPRLGGDVSRFAFALFLGAAMSVTAFPVLARILRESRLDRTHVGVLAIACAVIDDIMAWCLLAVVVAVVGASGSLDVLQVFGLSLVFLVVALAVVRPLLARLRSVPLPVALSLAVLAAWATEEIGVHAIFGAFLAGAIMPRRDDVQRVAPERLETMAVGLLLPMFFVLVGLRTRIDRLDDVYLWGIAGLVLAVAIAGKWGGSMLAARAVGERWVDATVIGALMNTRGLTGLVILDVGLSLGVVTPLLFTVMVLVFLITTVMAPPVLALTAPARDVPARPEPDVPVPPLRGGEPTGDDHRQSRPSPGQGRR